MVRSIAKSFSQSENMRKFMRFQVTAMIATSIDFLITIIFKEGLNVHYTVAVASGATGGAVTAFSLNRYWVFNARENNPLGQGVRYLMVAGGSVILNTLGTYILTDYLQIQYLISKAIIALIIGFTYSYYFSRRFVFYA